MTKLIGTFAVSGTLVLLPLMARAQDYDYQADLQADPGMAAEPSTPAPSEPPPALPSTPAPQVEAASSLPAGQWVHTQQYGWIWMPYSDRFTYAPADGYGEPYAYVYYPAYGWTWIAAPWVWGIGPWPFFGVIGPARFAWYVHGWWRFPARWHYAPFRGGFHGIRPAPVFRGGIRHAPPFRGHGWGGGPRPAPFRGGSAFIGGRRGGGFGSHVGPMGRGGFGAGGMHPGGHGVGHGFTGGHGFHGGGHGGRGRG